MRTPAFAASVERNSRHRCNLLHCELPRMGLFTWCKRHSAAARRYGHPHGRPLAPALWATERSQVADLFARNVTHEGQRQALTLVQGLLNRAASNEGTFKGAEEFARLARHGVTARDILTELCAATLHLTRNPRTVPVDGQDKAWDFAVSSALFKLAARPRRITQGPRGGKVDPTRSYAPKPRTSALAYVGRHLRQCLAPFIANVQNAIESRDSQQAAFEAALSAPLSAI